MHKEKLKLKFLGCLVGTAIGDALGARREGRGLSRSEDIFPLVEKLEQLIYTDDTHMTIGVAESLMKSKGFDGDHMTQIFTKNYEAEPWRGYGPGPPIIFGMIRSGESWCNAANRLYRGGSFGNGSAMRVAPVGLLYSRKLETLREIAYQSSSITHSHELGKEGAALQACAVALALNTPSDEDIDREAFLSRLQNFIRNQLYKEKNGPNKRVAWRARQGEGGCRPGKWYRSTKVSAYGYLLLPEAGSVLQRYRDLRRKPGRRY